jgi:hypothetical protein
VIVFGKTDQRRQYIKAWHGCYDPLGYPMYSPRGEIGWNKFMPYSDAPVTPLSAAMTSTNNANPPSTTLPSTGGYPGILYNIILYALILVLLNRCYNS